MKTINAWYLNDDAIPKIRALIMIFCKLSFCFVIKYNDEKINNNGIISFNAEKLR